MSNVPGDKPRLTDTQLIVLSAATQRDDGAVLLPSRTKGAAAQKFVNALIDKGFAREVRAKRGMPVIRSEEQTGHSFALVITKMGRAVVHVDDDAAREEAAVSGVVPSAPAAQADCDARQRSQTPGEGGKSAVTAGLQNGAGSQLPDHTPDDTAVASASLPNAPRDGSKIAEVIALLIRPEGAGIEELVATTGWLPHTTRAALTGLRKRGYAIRHERDKDKGTTYRITPTAEARVA